MILKWLITGVIIFGIYRYFIKPNGIDAAQQQPQVKNESQDNIAGEFIDYEEVD